MSWLRVLSACVLLAACAMASAARAGDYVYFGGTCYWFVNAPECFRDAQREIYHSQNFIAHLEADPNVDDGYKGAAIPWTRAYVHHLRTATGVRHHMWPTACCYRRQAIYIR
jgi:hypothetical protein